MNEDHEPPAGHQTGKWIRDERPDLWRWLTAERIGVLGYGNQGRAQALILRDRSAELGFQVDVASREGGAGEQAARADGFDPKPVSRLLSDCTILLSLLPDERQAEVLTRERLEAKKLNGKTPLLCLAHGFGLVHGGLDPPPHWDVVLVAPTGPGWRLREEFLAGRGLPALFAVHQDASGHGRERALALAQALGLVRGGVYETTVQDETVVDLFGEQAVLCGGLVSLCLAAFDALVKEGYPADMAYLECVRQVGVTSDLLSRFGPRGFRERISRTALYGELTRGPRIINDQVRESLADILNEIVSGRFGEEWMQVVAEGGRELDRLMEQAGRHPSNAVFQRLPETS